MTFRTHFETNTFTRMLFGLKNALAAYKQVIYTIRVTLKRQLFLVYLDDTIVFSSSLDDHLAHLRVVSDKLEADTITLHS